MLIFDLDATLACAVPAKRDPNADCQDFIPWKREKNQNPIPIRAECGGDGHYLCLHCQRFKKQNEEETDGC